MTTPAAPARTDVVALSNNPRAGSRTLLVAEHLLRPLLVELGASTPTRPFAVTERQLDDLDALATAWADEAAPVLAALRGVPGGVG